MDNRYLSIKARLSSLPSKALKEFLDYSGPVCYDTYNYSEAEGFCPIAIMLSVPDYFKENDLQPSQESVLELIKRLGAQHPGFIFGTVKGVAGEFYTHEREQDLKWLCREILMREKNVKLK